MLLKCTTETLFIPAGAYTYVKMSLFQPVDPLILIVIIDTMLLGERAGWSLGDFHSPVLLSSCGLYCN